jgi:predicted ATPase/class 3 adenylate cyclase
MLCASCRTENREGAKFCVECGAAFGLRCGRCGHAIGAGAKFCADCGYRLESARLPPAPETPGPASEASPGERRHVTVLFCDLVSSTEIASRLDPEHWHAVAAEYQQEAGDAARRMGGHIAKYLGDGLVVCFGYPEAQENAAERAVRAGLAMVEAVAALNETAGKRYDIALSVRVGIHTGSVVMAKGGGVETDIFGDAPNIAARVQAAAEPNMVLLTEASHDLVAGLFVVEDFGAHALKGVDTPIQLYRAMRASLGGSHRRISGPTATPFVGRQEEVGLLINRWAAVREGEGRFVLATGEPGIGKTRLTEEFRERIKGEPHLWIETGGVPLLANTAFHAVTQLLHQGLGWRGDETAEERFARLEQTLLSSGLGPEAVVLVAELLGLPTPEAYSPLALSADERRRRLIEALVAWVFSVARTQPIVLVVEDLHWVDPSTLELVEMLAEQAATAPLLLICTARPEFRPGWPVRSHYAHLILNRLNRRDTRELVSGLVFESRLSLDMVDAVTARADGVPLFAEELARLMLERNGGASGPDIPATLEDSLAARLDRLGEAKEGAQLAAVIGRDFSFELLQSVAEWPTERLERALGRLADAELIYARGAPPAASYRFKHALILDAAYGALLLSKRRELHGRVARILVEQFSAIAEEQPELLARHWSEAGETDRAVAAWSEAAQRAAARAAHVEAVEHLRNALDALRTRPESDERARMEHPLLRRLAVSLSATVGYSVPEVGRALAEARAICEAQNDLPGLYSVLINICNFEATAGHLDAAEAAARRCEEISAETGLASHRIQAQYMIAYALYSKGELAEARRYLESSIELYKANAGEHLTFFTPTDALVESLSTLPIVLYALGETELAAQRADELLAHARSLERPYDLVYALGFRSVYDTFAGRFDDLLRHSAEGLAVCEANGFSTYRAVAATFQGIAIGQLRAVPEGLAVFGPAVADLRRLGVLRALGLYIGEAALLHLKAGDVEMALSTVDEALALSQRSYRICLPRLHRLRAEILAETPDAPQDEVLAALEEALAVAEAQGARAFAEDAAGRLANLKAAPEDAATA